MKSWSYGTNSLHKKASIYLEEAPFYIFALDFIVTFICGLIPAVSLPKIKKKLSHPDDIVLNDGKQWTTWNEWYGDLSQFFHLYFHIPIFDFCTEHTIMEVVPINYDKYTKKSKLKEEK